MTLPKWFNNVQFVLNTYPVKKVLCATSPSPCTRCNLLASTSFTSKMINISSWVTDTLVMYGLPKCLPQPQNQLQINSFCGSLNMASQMLSDQTGAINFVKLLHYFVKIIRLNMNLLLLTTLSQMALLKQQLSLSSFCLKKLQNQTKISMLHYQLSDRCHVLMATALQKCFSNARFEVFSPKSGILQAITLNMPLLQGKTPGQRTEKNPPHLMKSLHLLQLTKSSFKIMQLNDRISQAKFSVNAPLDHIMFCLTMVNVTLELDVI